MRVMGQTPMQPSAFRNYLQVVRTLLAGEEVEYQGKPIKFLDRELGCINIEDKVPIYVAANGPKALEAAGAFGDGRIGAGNEPYSLLTQNLKRMHRGAQAVGRKIEKDFHTSVLTFACVLKPGEKLTSDRVIDETGAEVVSTLHFWYEIYQQRGNDDFIQGAVRDIWEQYKTYVTSEMPEERRHQILHKGHCAFLPSTERRFITPQMIRVSGGLVGQPDEIIERLQKLEAGGLKEVALLPPIAVARQNFKDFAEFIMAKY